VPDQRRKLHKKGSSVKSEKYRDKANTGINETRREGRK
jgi:hypothetical protein